jgi:integrase
MFIRLVLRENAVPRTVSRMVRSVLEEVRGELPVYVFTWENRKGERDQVGHFRNSGWNQARRRAAARYPQELGREAPAGFRDVRVHDLRHTFGRRLRAAGVSFEDRQTSWATAPQG